MVKKLKTKTSNRIKNIYVLKEDLVEKQSKNGNKFYLWSVGNNEIIINEKWVGFESKDKTKISVGIKLDSEYALYGTDQTAIGVDIVNYFWEIHEESKLTEKTKEEFIDYLIKEKGFSNKKVDTYVSVIKNWAGFTSEILFKSAEKILNEKSK